jgi:peptidoglycan hydrolase CwlO-like protein
MGKIINSVVEVVQEEWREFYDDNFQNPDPHTKLEERLRILYGRGEITREHYLQLRSKVTRGLVSKTDLEVIHHKAILRMQAEGKTTIRRGDKELEHSLDRLYADKVWLEDARDPLKENLEALRNLVNWFAEQAEAARQDAKTAMPNEAAVRVFLEVWQKLLALSQSLEEDLKAMESDLNNLDSFENEINAAISRATTTVYREQLANLSQRIHADILSPR